MFLINKTKNLLPTGTEAAAATAIVIKVSAALNPIIFDADHPFLFVIRERSTQSTLFMGRLIETSEDGKAKSGFQSGSEAPDPNGTSNYLYSFLILMFSLASAVFMLDIMS